MLELYNQVCRECSELITKRYSTSFSLGIRLFGKRLRAPIYSIYGFVRFADEIVDTFHDYPKQELLTRFREETYKAISQGISLNPILNSFQSVVNEYGIDIELIDAFLDSMEMDLSDQVYDTVLYKQYIYGSAEVIGLMCLRVFVKDEPESYDNLKGYARSLGSAFQKINFLRDIKDDFFDKGRTYFPGINIDNFSDKEKNEIEADIDIDFKDGYIGIKKLPKSARFGVYIAYIFYYHLLLKIKAVRYDTILNDRVRINNRKKAFLLAKYSIKNSFNRI